MSMIKTIVSLVLLCFCFVTKSKDQKIYKHVDNKGIIHYSSKKPVGKSYKLLNIRCPECSAWRNRINWNTTPLIDNKFGTEISIAARTHGVDEHLLRAVIHAESAYKHKAVSSAGAQGLMQLMPLTQKTYQVTDPFDPQQNINGGAAYLKHLINIYSTPDVFLAAYNSGETAVEKYGKTVPPFPETKEYVRRVKILMNRYKKHTFTNRMGSSTTLAAE